MFPVIMKSNILRAFDRVNVVGTKVLDLNELMRLTCFKNFIVVKTYEELM